MILRFPASTADLIAQNPAIHADAILERLRFFSLMGCLRLLGDGSKAGRWYVIPGTTVDRDYTKPDKAPIPTHPCLQCGGGVIRRKAKYCSPECKDLARTKPRRPCVVCGKPSKRATGKYCGRACSNLASVGRAR